MTDETVVSVVQFAPGADVEANRSSIAGFVERAAALGARLVVFPEYSSFFVHPLGAEFVEAAEPLDGPFVAELGRLAGAHRIHVVAGLVERTDDPARFSNTLVAVGPDGALEATYRKQHLYDAFGASESSWVVPGSLDEPQTFDLDGFRVGMQTCYDIRFPEVTRRLVDAGAELVLVPAEWVRGPLKEKHWSTLLAARAIENTVYVAAADQTPPIGVGGSVILDPMGVALAGLGETPGLTTATVSRERLDAVRESNPSLALRRYRVVER
ncbi:carbon-nitrogen hydrolase family protein [Diaminobutyricibacter tongyongensis]|uniref:Carbon-nitrogen hydrolase family protein n=1 Tax=Leifsonia tongyongensis TaxID=1268043 RepID=A0A6L9XZG1_9MICO|nr:carbon-nitrogen hydrolase family protein [Diaminobutyricibacter tongyongensis]NEN06822.1 carbon-nitrogen hydrolase family protein [Diaminobutyricibacter tongyongensis]